MKTFTNYLIIAFVFIVSLPLNSLAQNDDYNFRILKNFEIYQQVLKHLSTNYVYQIDPDQLVSTSIKSMLKTLDPYTVYITGEQLTYLKIISESKYTGIGIKFTVIDSFPYILEIIPNSPAEKSGLKIGDKILKINNILTKNKTLEQLQILLSGDNSTTVKLTIKNLLDSVPKSLVIQRQKINYPSISSYFIVNNFGYIKIYSFNPGVYRSFREILQKFKNQNIKGLIIDLRNNPGGLLNEAVDILSTLLPYNTLVVKTLGRNPQYITNYYTNKRPIDTTLPVAILVNSKSASASEIVSGVVQDLDRGVIIGNQTFGKGLVQRIFDLPYNSKIKITIAQYILPSGRCIQKINYARHEPVYSHNKFYTKNHRIVYEGNGIIPDITITQLDSLPDFIVQLKKKYIIRFFASYYLQLFPDFDTELFKKNGKNLFISFLKSINFVYSNKTLSLYNNFLNNAKDLPDNLRIKFLQLKDSLYLSNQYFVDKYWPILNNLILNELLDIKRDNMLSNSIKPQTDLALQKAIYILNNRDLYNKILNKK